MADSQQQSAVGSGIAQAYGQGASATVNIGLKPEDVAMLLQGAGAAAQAKIDQLAVELRASSEAVRGFLRILKENEVLVEQLTTKLTLIAQRHVDMLDRLAALEPEDDEAQGHIDEAREVLRDAASMADYDRADELLSMAENAQVETLRRAEELAREATQAVRRLHLNAAATRAERGELSRTRFDYLEAAKHFREAAELVSGDDALLRLNYLMRSAGAFFSYGDEKGDRAVLAQAIEVYREVLEDKASEQEPLDRAATRNNLGNALRKIGERESGPAHLEEAVIAFRATLSEYPREDMPLEWARTQFNLGAVLAIMGRRRAAKFIWGRRSLSFARLLPNSAERRSGRLGRIRRIVSAPVCGLSENWRTAQFAWKRHWTRIARHSPSMTASRTREIGRYARTTSASRFGSWESGRAIIDGWKKQSRPTGRLSPHIRWSRCRWIGRWRSTTWAICWWLWKNGNARGVSWKRRSPLIARLSKCKAGIGYQWIGR
jgi:tetratricopeptide (TPR) repeat protein